MRHIFGVPLKSSFNLRFADLRLRLYLRIYHYRGLLRLSAKSYAKKYFSLTLAPFAEFTFRHELRCTTSLSESLFYIRFTNLRL